MWFVDPHYFRVKGTGFSSNALLAQPKFVAETLESPKTSSHHLDRFASSDPECSKP